MHIRAVLALLALMLGLTINEPSYAQKPAGYPSRPVKILVPYGAGGMVDTAARFASKTVSEVLGQPVVVENRPGAGGAIAGGEVARSAPDGHTLLMDSMGTLITLSLTNPQLPFDAWRDFTPIATLTKQPLFLGVRTTLPVNNLAELVALAKAKPGSLTFGSPGKGTEVHLVTELFKTEARIDMLHVPYKGGGPAVVDLAAGRTDLLIITVSAFRPALEQGKVRLIATLNPERVPAMNDVPSVVEAGYPNLVHVPYTALFAPARTPAPIIQHWAQILPKLRDDASMQKWAESTGSEISVLDPATVAKLMQAERQKWKPIVDKLDPADR
jgi:tripartite-type tricarboxylate transporter receptor subunit TctC